MEDCFGMDTVNVLISSWGSEELKRRLTDISPRVKVTDITGVFDSRERTAPEKKIYASDEPINAILAETEVMYSIRVPSNIVELAPNLKWIQCPLAGVDQILSPKLIKSKVQVTNSSGVHGPAISELVMTMMLMFARHMNEYYEKKQRKDFSRIATTLLEFKTIGIVGLGSIGEAISQRAKAFDMKVIATRRSIQKTTYTKYVDAVYPKEELTRLLKESDYVVLALPWTPETNKMIGERELKMMKPTAFIVNIGRGAIIDEDALILALEQGWIAGAGLDCFAREPLPVDSKLWTLDNVIITPHVAHGGRENTEPKVIDIFCENMRRYLSGKRLINIVDKKTRY
jgi:D-2-hydroxyacid dehydrogenase (NADP+)